MLKNAEHRNEMPLQKLKAELEAGKASGPVKNAALVFESLKSKYLKEADGQR